MAVIFLGKLLIMGNKVSSLSFCHSYSVFISLHERRDDVVGIQTLIFGLELDLLLWKSDGLLFLVSLGTVDKGAV